ncbi:MAG: FtsB family cell division protein, partial [Candidatus Binatia bacterium]
AAALPLAALIAGSIFGSGGLFELRRLQSENAVLSEDVFQLLRENEELRRRILALRRSDRELERLARRELGLVRDGEIVYRFRSRTDEPRGESQ